MTRSIAHIALILLLIAPICSVMTALLGLDRQQTAKVYSLVTNCDMEDTDDTPTSEDEQDDEVREVIMIEKYTLNVTIHDFERLEPSQDQLFWQHDQEVGTPPPRA